MTARPDLVIAGGGLSGGLLALALAQARPGLAVRVLDAADEGCNAHTWSFHAGDLDAEGEALVAPLIAARWPRQEVRFPHFRRTLPQGYASVAERQFRAVLRQRLGDRLITGRSVAALSRESVHLEGGEAIAAGAVIDARGLEPTPHLALGYQKFVGHELVFEAPHGLDAPVIMDAQVPQRGGFRFLYLLPFAPDRLLAEATLYADAPELEEADLAASVSDYAAQHFRSTSSIVRREKGVLPITLSGHIDAFWKAAEGVPRAGLRAGLFHPVTGYSLPEAVRLALMVARLPSLAPEPLFRAIEAHAKARWHAQGFYRALNRMLFRAAAPERRVEVMEHFYRLPDALVGRFYAGRSTLLDKAVILSGKPPVPVGAALKALLSHEKGAAA